MGRKENETSKFEPDQISYVIKIRLPKAQAPSPPSPTPDNDW
jgi:hypothetical protein